MAPLGTLEAAESLKHSLEAAFQQPESTLRLIEHTRFLAPEDQFARGLSSTPIRELGVLLESTAPPFVSAAALAVPLPRITRRIIAQAEGPTPRLTVGYGATQAGSWRVEMRVQHPTVAAVLRARNLALEAGLSLRSLGILREITTHSGPHPASLDNNPLTIGSSVGIAGGGAGTLGAFLRDEAGRPNLLSCSHVIARAGHAAAGEHVFHPSPRDRHAPRLIGRLDRFTDLRDGSAKPWEAAVALIDPAAGWGGNVIPCGHGFAQEGRTFGAPWRGPLPPSPRVAKIGRRTGRTEGKVTLQNLNIDITFNDLGRAVEVEGLIEVAWDSLEAPFSEAGDSGSLVFLADTLQPIGILVGGGLVELGDGTIVGRSYASPIATFLDAWRMTLL